MEKQLCKWSNLICIGKRLRVAIAFNYRQYDDNSVPASRIVEKSCVSNEQNACQI